jgi:ribonuclease P protein component
VDGRSSSDGARRDASGSPSKLAEMSRAVTAFGLPRTARLRQANDIQAVFQAGRREERRAFVLLWVPRPGSGRAGFAVSRQIRGAVQRNRARRRLREAYRTLGPSRAIGVDAVFVARARALQASIADLQSDMRQALERAHRSAGS